MFFFLIGLLIGIVLGKLAPKPTQTFVKSKVIPSSYVAKTLRDRKWRP